MENIYLDEKEEKLLDDLLLYNRQIKELFKDQKNYQTIKLIDDIIIAGRKTNCNINIKKLRR